MTITDIKLIPNKELPRVSVIKERMDIKIPGVIEGIPNRNGFIWALVGSGGSGKSNVLLNSIKTKGLYRNVFHNIFYCCPQSSFLSVEKHPLSEHDKVYHELTPELLDDIYEQLKDIKANSEEQEYSLVVIDDQADVLKDKDIQRKLNQMLIKARHLSCAFIFCVQSFYLLPKIVRKQLTNISIFKPKNIEEWNSIAKELLHLNKDDASKVYDFVFSEPYSHLDIDTVEGKMYKNFNYLDIK